MRNLWLGLRKRHLFLEECCNEICLYRKFSSSIDYNGALTFSGEILHSWFLFNFYLLLFHYHYYQIFYLQQDCVFQQSFCLICRPPGGGHPGGIVEYATSKPLPPPKAPQSYKPIPPPKPKNYRPPASQQYQTYQTATVKETAPYQHAKSYSIAENNYGSHLTNGVSSFFILSKFHLFKFSLLTRFHCIKI